MAIAGLLTDVAGARTVWALAGAVYLVAALIAFVMTRRIHEAAVAAHPELAADGISRLERLLGEVDATHRAEAERPRRALPYVPRRRASGGEQG
jgi:hypothetical protein